MPLLRLSQPLVANRAMIVYLLVPDEPADQLPIIRLNYNDTPESLPCVFSDDRRSSAPAAALYEQTRCCSSVDDVDELAVNISFEYINGKSTSTCIWPAFYRRIVKELDDLGWKHVEYVDKELTTIILIIIDGADRKHLLHFNGLQPDSYACCAIAVSCESICYELPTALSVERLQTITTLFEEFSAQIHAYQDVWNELDGFDGDDKKSRADLQRRVSLADGGTIAVEFKQRPNDAPVIHAITGSLPEEIVQRISLWPQQTGSIRSKLEWLLGAALKQSTVSTKAKDPGAANCAICYDELPPSSDDEDRIDCACKQSFHCRCIMEWSRTLSTTRLSFRRIFTSCPNCDGPLVIAAHQQRNW